MGTQRSTRFFRSGNCKAVRLPADYPLELGGEVVVRQEGGRFVIEPVPSREAQLAGFMATFGSMPWLKPLASGRGLEERALDPGNPAVEA